MGRTCIRDHRVDDAIDASGELGWANNCAQCEIDRLRVALEDAREECAAVCDQRSADHHHDCVDKSSIFRRSRDSRAFATEAAECAKAIRGGQTAVVYDQLDSLREALQEADRLMGHDDEATEWREKYAHLWPNAIRRNE